MKPRRGAPDGAELHGRVEAVLDPRRVALRGVRGACALAFDADHGLAAGDLLAVRVEGDGPARRVVRELGRARPTDPRPFANADVRRLGTPAAARMLALRDGAREAARGVFRAMGFVEVETPSVAENPGMDVHLAAPGVVGLDAPTDGRAEAPAAWLVTSPEYHMKRLLAAGHGRVFQLARCFRAGERGARHQPEFTMLEWYRAWSSLDDVLDDAEDLVRAVCALGGAGPVARRGGRAVPLDAPFARLTVREAFARHCPEVRDPIALARDDEEAYYALLASRVEPALGWDAPVFLTRYPACHASLARVCADDPSVALRAELYVAGLELCNAFDELTDPAEQRARFVADREARAARGLPAYPLDEALLAALAAGMPPSAGNALGFDRLLMLALGAQAIDEVVAFPR